MKLKLILSFLILFGTSAYLICAEIRVEGTVFADKNANGVLDRGEKGIKNIPVSNGVDIVFTDSKGNYRINCSSRATVFPILPSEYKFPLNQAKIPNSNFKFLDVDSRNTIAGVHFGLLKAEMKRSFSLTAVGDIQVKDADELNYASKSVISELAGGTQADLNIMLGDLVNDDPALFLPVKQLLNNLSTPTWTVYGNHDREVNDSSTSDDAYRRHFGASVYAFNAHNTHFLVLNNMQPKGRYGYDTRFSDDELRFVKNDLELVPRNCLLIIAMHGPLQYTKNKEQLLALLHDRPNVLVLSGHTHIVERYFHRNNIAVIPEIGVGASCGMWWTGEKNELGVPTALMQCGSYPNYFKIHISDGKYGMAYKAVGLDAGRQMEVWADTIPATTQGLNAATDSVRIVANIFAGSDSTQVWLTLNNTLKLKMQKTDMVSPNVSKLLSLYNNKVYPTAGNTRNPLRRRSSPHIWSVTVPVAGSAVYSVQIDAGDNYGFKATRVQVFNNHAY
ncbi:MAG: Ser/Thr phosphatase [Bacteroidetes bacterium]|nr:Ser/Thr phosphatase [Bacteroidota bacterium]